MIHVDDLTSLLVALLRAAPRGAVLTAADARPGGYSWREVLHLAALAVGNPRARLFHAPMALLHAIALGGDIARAFGSANMLNHQKLRELRHPDWSVGMPNGRGRPAGSRAIGSTKASARPWPGIAVPAGSDHLMTPRRRSFQ